MTAKQKALQLITRFQETSHKMGDHSFIYTPTAKHHALICVDEVLGYTGADRGYEFWSNVKQELENL